jgi:uncharacterized protein
MTTSYAPGTPMWIDLGSNDLAASKAFYGRLFGWEFQDLGPEAGGYNFANIEGRMVAGVGPNMDPSRPTAWAVVFATDDADATAAKVESNGGAVVMAPMDVMDSGRMAVFADPTGAMFTVWQPRGHQGAEVTHQPGSMTWAELSTSDVNAVKDFYPAVMPVTASEYDLGEGNTYTLLNVGDESVAGMMTNPSLPPQWSLYFEVDDCDAVADRAIELGATELMRDDAPPGRLAMMIDPQGAPFSIIKSDPEFAM